MRKIERIAPPVTALGFLAWSAAFIRVSSSVATDGHRYFCLFDDAMISMRYAWNFAHGSGLVWNPGEYVQGYTNFLMTLLMALAAFSFSKSAAVLCIQILGALMLLMVAWLAMRIVDRLAGRDSDKPYGALLRMLAFFCALAYYPLNYWTLMGMETGLLTLCLLSGVFLTFRYVDHKRAIDLYLAAACMGLANWTRTDSVVFAFPIGLYLLWEARAQSAAGGASAGGGAAYRRLALGALVYLGFVASLLVFQKLYYGDMLPNTYTLKLTGRSLIPRAWDGYVFARPWLDQMAPILILALVDLIYAFSPRKLLLAALVLASLTYEIYVGGDPWRYWRIMAPTVPLASLLALQALAGLARALSRSPAFDAYFGKRPLIPAAQALVLVGALLMMRFADVTFWKEVKFIDRPYTAYSNGVGVNIALGLRDLTDEDAVIGVVWAGSIPYYSGRRSVDFLGKCDRYIARLPPDESGAVGWGVVRSVPGHNKYDLNYSIKKLRPDYVAVLNYGQQDLTEWAKDKYVSVECRGRELLLAKDSPHVHWDKLGVQSAKTGP